MLAPELADASQDTKAAFEAWRPLTDWYTRITAACALRGARGACEDAAAWCCTYV